MVVVAIPYNCKLVIDDVLEVNLTIWNMHIFRNIFVEFTDVFSRSDAATFCWAVSLNILEVTGSPYLWHQAAKDS